MHQKGVYIYHYPYYIGYLYTLIITLITDLQMPCLPCKTYREPQSLCAPPDQPFLLFKSSNANPEMQGLLATKVRKSSQLELGHR